MFTEDEEDILWLIESRAVEYLQETGMNPEALIMSVPLYSKLITEIEGLSVRPFGTEESYNAYKLGTSVGLLDIHPTTRYGDEFMYIGLYKDIVASDGEMDLAEKYLLGSVDEHNK